VSSQIIETNPTSGTAKTSDVRDNFGFAKTEINEMQRMTEDKVVTTGDYDVQVANFSNDVTAAEGARITIEVGSLSGGANNANDTTNPTLAVDSIPAKTICNSDGSSLQIGDLKAGTYLDLIYDASITGGANSPGKWKILNSYTQLLSNSNFFTTTLGLIYPVGHILTTVKSGNPGTADYFASGVSFGTWAAYGAGRVMVGLDGTDTDFDVIKETGGSKTHTLDITEIPDHRHAVFANEDDDRNLANANESVAKKDTTAGDTAYVLESSGTLDSTLGRTSGVKTTGTAAPSSIGQAHTIVQSYITTYLWERTA
tara:strand:+ start:262 stop:1200 length:939 start_codon:yes stop_codon:yes gene_type:complete